MNLKIIDKVKKSFCKHKKTIKGIVIAVIALLSVYSFMLPFSDGFYTAPLRMKTLGIGSTICGIVFFIIVIITTLKNAKKDKKYYYDILCASPLMLLEIVNIFMIFDCGFLGFKTIIVGISLISVLLIEIFISIRALFHNSFGKELSPVLLLTLAVTSCLFSLANISSGNLEYAKIFAKICFGCAYLVAIALYTNKLIYTPRNPDKPINTIICFIFWGAFITITFPFYVQCCGLTGENFNTFVSVYAAVLGGGITLAGVAWTIKDANDDKKKDLILQNKPILYAHMMNGLVTLKETPIDLLFIDFERIKQIQAIQDLEEEDVSESKDQSIDEKQSSRKPIETVTLKSLVNTDNSIIIIKKITVNDVELTPLNNNVMAKSKAYNLSLHIPRISDGDKIKLYVEDVLNNPYCFTIMLYIHDNKKGGIQYGIMRIEECELETQNE